MEEAKVFFREGDPLIAYVGGNKDAFEKMTEKLKEVTQLRAFFTLGTQGVTEALRKVISGAFQAGIAMGSWEIPEEYEKIQKKEKLTDEQMFEVFPMGISAMAIVSGWDAERAVEAAEELGIEGYVIGELLKKQLNAPEIILI